MKNALISLSALTLMALPAACNRAVQTPVPTENATMGSGTMAGMPMAGGMMHGKTDGTVTAIDPVKGSITLDHGSIAALQWPAMKMGFVAAPDLLKGIKVGDKVAFEIDWDGKIGTVTKIHPLN